MGLRGQVPSADPQRPHRADLAPSVVVGSGSVWWPEPEDWWELPVQEAWRRFRESELYGVTVEVDIPSLQRLFTYYDAWVRTAEEWQRRARDGDVLGLTGGKEPAEAPHALIAQMQRLEQMMDKLEARFGISPAMRARLGIKLGEAIQTAAKLNTPTRQRRGS